MGYAAGADPVQHTNPYYRSVYVLLVKRGAGLDGVDRLSDARLRGKRLGVIAATPPADHLLEEGLLATAKSYALLVDRRTETPAEDMSPTSSPNGSTARFCGGRSVATSRDARPSR